MHLRAAQFFRIDNLTNGSFHQRRTGKVKSTSFGHQDFVAQHRQISSAGDTVAHDRGKLRNARRGNDRVISEDATKIIFIRKNLILHGQKYASGIDEINDGQRAFKGDPLRANDLFGCLREERASLHGRVVGNNHARNTFDTTNASHDSSCRNLTPLLVHFVSSPKADLKKWRIFVQQMT